MEKIEKVEMARKLAREQEARKRARAQKAASDSYDMTSSRQTTATTHLMTSSTTTQPLRKTNGHTNTVTTTTEVVLPLLYVDVSVARGKPKVRLAVWEGDTPELVAEQFASRYHLSGEACLKLGGLLKMELEKVRKD